MKKLQKVSRSFICKYGHVIACCAFAFVAVAANSQCLAPFYEPEEPSGLEKFRRF